MTTSSGVVQFLDQVLADSKVSDTVIYARSATQFFLGKATHHRGGFVVDVVCLYGNLFFHSRSGYRLFLGLIDRISFRFTWRDIPAPTTDGKTSSRLSVSILESDTTSDLTEIEWT